MGGSACHEGASFLGLEPTGHVLRRSHPAQAEPGRGDRVSGHGAHRAQECGEDLVDVPHQRTKGARVRAAVHPQ